MSGGGKKHHKIGAYEHAVENIRGGSSHHSHHIDTENLSSLKDYEKSYASKAKEETIKKMARAMKKVGMNVNPDDDLDKIINDLNREIPNPKKGKTFAAESKTQEKVCKIVAGVLNDEFTPGAQDSEKFIDMTLPAIEICRAVGEYTHSFNQGVNTEFLGVIGSVKNALHSMNLMDQVMNELYMKIQANIGKVDDSILEREIKPLNDVYIRAKHEREQKKMVLENLLHVHLEPASRVLNDALREHGNDLALVKKLGLKLGSTDFANAIAAALSGLGSTASIANHVHKALKTVGISMNDYVNSSTFKDFQQKLDSIVDEGKMNDKDLVKFLTASKYLREGFDYRTDEKFKKIIAQGGRQGMMGGQYSGGRRSRYNMDSLDSVDSDVFGNPLKSSIRRKARSIMAEKELISKDFVIRLDRHYNELLEAMKDIAINLGKTIPLTSKTELLKDSLQHLDDASMTGTASTEMTIELIVSRGIDTMDARRKKEQYINKLKMIANACESIMGMEAYRATSSKFAKVKDVVSKIEKMIEYYSNIGSKNRDRMSDVGEYDRKYADSIRDPSGSSRHSEQSRPSPVQSNSDDEGDSFAAEGGADFEYKEIDVPQIAKTGLTLNEIINTFNYYYYLAGVRNNLKISSREYDLFGEDYSNMLGNSIAKRLYDLDLNHKKDIKYITDHFKANNLLAAGNRFSDKFIEEAKKWVNSEYNIKIKFYKALQALDLYLKEFTPAITSNIDTVKEIKTMLDETQVIARWFNESTGNELCHAFDELPGYDVNCTPGDNSTPIFLDSAESKRYPIKYNDTGEHYYTAIQDNIRNAEVGHDHHVAFGNPVFGRSIIGPDDKNLKKVHNMQEKVNSAIDHFQALKNIVNTFIRIGNKFGTTDLSTKVFMSPSQIYRVLFNFLKQSALRMHIPKESADTKKNAVGAVSSELMLSINNDTDDQLAAINPTIGHSARANANPAILGDLLLDATHTISPFSVYFTGFANGIVPNAQNDTKSHNHYEIENIFFHAMIKAMAGKIMTVVGSYDMLEMAPPKHWITDTRMILGGGKASIIEGGKKARLKSKGNKYGGSIENPVSSDDRLEIIQEAMSLYFKLPRLIEFYKDILDPNKAQSSTSMENILFLPDLDGLFTNLYLLIFRKTKTPEHGEYSDMELHKIVEEINIVYRYYSKQKSHDIITAVVNDIVLDVNRKYGLMKSDDYKTWVEMTKERENAGASGQIRVNTTNYSILPDEDEYEINKFAPSDIYKGISRSGDVTYDTVSGQYINNLTGAKDDPFSSETPGIASGAFSDSDRYATHPHSNLIKDFRKKLDEYFKDTNIQNMSSYTIMVHQAEDDVKNARSNREKISTVFQLIQGTGNLGLKNDKAILFHETIIAGLNVLSGIYLMLHRYSNNIKDSDPLNLEKKLVDILYGLLCVTDKTTTASEIHFTKLQKNDINNNYTAMAYAVGTNDQVPAAGIGRIGYESLRIPQRTNDLAHVPLTKGGSYFFNNGVYKHVFDDTNGMTKKTHEISNNEYRYLIQPIMLDEPIFRGTKILPYHYICRNSINAVNIQSYCEGAGVNLAQYSTESYANDSNNLYELKNVYIGALPVVADNLVNGTFVQNIIRPHNKYEHFYKSDYGDGTALTNIQLNSHPTYRILETIIKQKIRSVENRLYADNNVAGVNNFLVPSQIIDYNNISNNDGILTNKKVYIKDRNGAHVEDINLIDKKNLLFMRLLSRTGVNYQYIMENLLENIYALTIDSNGLIDLTYYKVENDKIRLNLNFTKLQNVVNGIITDLKFYLEYFRPFLKKDVIAHYETETRSGSLYDLEKKFNYFFNPNTDTYNTSYDTLERAKFLNTETLSDQTSQIFNNLTRDTGVAMSALKHLLPGLIYNLDDYNAVIAQDIPVNCLYYNDIIISHKDKVTIDNTIANDDTKLCIYDLLYENYKKSKKEIDELIFDPALNTPVNSINKLIKMQYRHETRFEWYGNTMSNLIFYDFSKKMPYDRITQEDAKLVAIKTPSFTTPDKIIKIDEFNSRKDSYRDARFATEFYCYPHGHFKLRELLGDSGREIKALDMLVTNHGANNVKYADDTNGVERIPNHITAYRYTAISMFAETENQRDPNANPFKFDDYIQLSAQRISTTLLNDYTIANNRDFSVNNNYPTMETLDHYSYPINDKSNNGYNMGIQVKDLKRPSKDFEYKLHDLIARTAKTSDSRSSQGHLIQWPHSRNGDSDVREYIRAPLYSHECVAFDHNSLMFIFNQILSRFLTAFIDPSTGNKIYKNLVNGFINGVASKVTSQPDTGFPDLYRCGTYNAPSQKYVAGHSNSNSIENQHSMMFQKVLGLRGDVKPDSIVFQSLAYILQRIGKDLDRGSGSNLHLLNTLTDVPIYMKESYKANLPSFIKIFDYIIQKAEFFKNIIQKTDIKLNRYSQCDFANFINSCTGLTDVRVNDVRYELHSYFVPAKYLMGLDSSSLVTNIGGVAANIKPINDAYNDIMRFLYSQMGIAAIDVVIGNAAQFRGLFATPVAGGNSRHTTDLAVHNEIADARYDAGVVINNVNASWNPVIGALPNDGLFHFTRLVADTVFLICVNAIRASVAAYNALNAGHEISDKDYLLDNINQGHAPIGIYLYNFISNKINDNIKGIKDIYDNWLILAAAAGGQHHDVILYDPLIALVKAIMRNQYAADYPDQTLSLGDKLVRQLHPLYNSADYFDITPFNANLDRIHSNDDNEADTFGNGMIRNLETKPKEDKVKISCTRGTRGYNLKFVKPGQNGTNVFRDYKFNHEFLKITDKNANRVNGFLSIEGIEPLSLKNESSDSVKNKFLAILDSIIANAYNISDCCDEVLKELGDTPVYFETYDGSIENYQVRNNADQFMPLSLSLWFMNNNSSLTQSQDMGPSHILFSGHNLGTSNFKMLYGTRQVLSRNLALTYEEIPGVKTILTRHNSSASDRPIEESRYLQFINRMITGLRFIVNSHGYKRIIAYNSNGVSAPTPVQSTLGMINNTIWNYTGNTQFVALSIDKVLHYNENDLNKRNTVYALNDGNRKKELILQLLEDSFQENSVNKILQAFYINEKQSQGISRKDERIRVIIDSSINPINVHALMQDIPLANIYNYQYTFETMAASMYGMLMRNVGATEDINESKHPLKQTILEFLRLLRDPFARVNKLAFTLGNNYEQPLFNIFIGDGSLGMGRPKFLSDQLFNKCLLNNIYYENTRPMVKGPAPKSGSEVNETLINDGQNNFRLDNTPVGGININKLSFDVGSFARAGADIESNTVHAGYGAYVAAIAGNGRGAGNIYAEYLADDAAIEAVVRANPNYAPYIDIFRFIALAATDDDAEANWGARVNAYHPIYMRAGTDLANPRTAANGTIATVLERLYSNALVARLNEMLSEYRKLLKRTPFYNKFMSIVKTNRIYKYLMYENIQFGKSIPGYQNRINIILEHICEIAFLQALGFGNVNFFGVNINGAGGVGRRLCTDANGGVVAGLTTAFNDIDNVDCTALALTDLNIQKMCSNYVYLSIQRFFTNNPPNLITRAIKFNQQYSAHGYNPNSILVMSYLKEYQYRGKFEPNDYITNNNKSNPLVRFDYAQENVENLRNTLQNIGFLRFNTNVIRNLFFISNILRIIRLQINREFTQNRSILKSSHFAISPSVTEYGMMDPNESFNSTYRDAKSFNDSIENYSNSDEKSTYYDLIDEDDAL